MKHTIIIIIALMLAAKDDAKPSDIFWNDLKIHSFHLKISETEWNAMKALDPHKPQPTWESSDSSRPFALEEGHGLERANRKFCLNPQP